MKRKTALFLVLFFAGAASLGSAEDKTDPSVEKAVQDYREFSKQLNVLNQQYQQITGQMTQILKEEGVPTVDENTGEFSMKPFEVESEGHPAAAKTDVANLVRQTDKEMIVSMALPGLKRETIKVRVEDGRSLRVQAEKKSSTWWGDSVNKVIPLPANADEEGAVAKYEDGILSVTIPKASKKDVFVPVQ